MADFIFDGWAPLGRTFAVGIVAYSCLVVMLRASGKRTLSKMNAFDLIVTVALGSTLATVLLSRDVSLAQGVLALALLICMQFIVTWMSVRVGWVRKLVTSEPALLAYDGKLIHRTLKRERVTPAEVFAALRAAGHGHLSEVDAVVLETEGSCTVLSSRSASASPLQGMDDVEIRAKHERLVSSCHPAE